MNQQTMTYAGTGVDYAGGLDPFKLRAQSAARRTANNITRFNNGEFRELESSRGESVYLIEAAKSYLGHVEEGLGTKNLVADAMYTLTGKSYYDQIAQDTVAMIVNDSITAGALPLSVAMHLAVGESSWFDDEDRANDLIDGWEHACNLARCVWGGGETPTLKGIIVPGTVLLSGSVVSLVKPKERLISGEIRHGDVIVLIESSGIHANGLTMAREIGERGDDFLKQLLHVFFPEMFPLYSLPEGYLTKLSDGRTYGEALLDPTHIYVGLVEDCFDRGVNIHYASNITGHGWRKLMRSTQSFTYTIEQLPTQLPIFDFIQKHGPVDDREAYGNLNMGAGFALYVSETDAPKVLEVAQNLGLKALVAGYIEAGEKQVIIKPKDLVYKADTLAVR